MVVLTLVLAGLMPWGAAPALCQSLGERTGIDAMLDRPPTASDVLLELHQFDLFQDGVTDSTDKRGDAGVKKFADTQSDAADTRDKALAALGKKAGLAISFPDQPSVSRSDRLAGLDGSVGQAYVRAFYDAEAAELTSTLSLIARYLAKPDNPDVAAFVAKMRPALQRELTQVKTAVRTAVRTAVETARKHE